jgi:hypothetical protein
LRPPDAARGTAETIATTTLLAWSGATFIFRNKPIWVRPPAVEEEPERDDGRMGGYLNKVQLIANLGRDPEIRRNLPSQGRQRPHRGNTEVIRPERRLLHKAVAIIRALMASGLFSLRALIATVAPNLALPLRPQSEYFDQALS